MRFRRGTHCVYYAEYHIVWTPRYRRRLLVKGVDKYLENMLKKLDELEEDIEVIKVNVQSDHVHIVTIIPPRLSVASVIQFMKSQSAKKLRGHFEFIKKAIRRGGVWSRGYCVSTAGLNEEAILRYVEHQEKEDKGQITLELGK
jgi:putative transposase